MTRAYARTWLRRLATLAVLLTVTPVGQAQPEAGPMAGGMPDPRSMSGQGRVDQTVAPRTLVVRTTYGDFTAAPPVGEPVHLVGYHADGAVVAFTVPTDGEGRATFTDLDISGATAYYALANLARGGGVDRMISTPVQLPPAAGVRLALSADKRDSTAPPIDDLSKFDPQAEAVPAGILRATFVTDRPDSGTDVRLVRARDGQVLATQRLSAAGPAGRTITGEFVGAKVNANVPAGTIEVAVVGGPLGAANPVEEVTLRTVDQAGKPGPTGITDKQGIARLSGFAPAEHYVLLIDTDQAPIASAPITLAATDVSGHRLGAKVAWFDGVPPRRAEFTVPADLREPVYVETTGAEGAVRSLPILPLPDRGTSAMLLGYPRLSLQFQLNGQAEDKYLGLNGRFSVQNLSWLPYRQGPDGTVIQLPKGFTGAGLAEQDSMKGSAEPGAGIRLTRAIPPGGITFHAFFSLPIHDGKAWFVLDLPWGVSRSSIAILKSPTMTFNQAYGQAAVVIDQPPVQFLVMRGLEIPAGRSLVLNIGGLPQRASWAVWLPRIGGILAGLILLGAVGLALWSRRQARVAKAGGVEVEIERLMAALAGLPADGGPATAREREALMTELEILWPQRKGNAESA